jgi:hypothetical protein
LEKVWPLNEPFFSPLAAAAGLGVGVGDVPPEGGAPDGVAVGAGLAADAVGVGAAVGIRAADGGVRKLKSSTTAAAVAARVTAAR